MLLHDISPTPKSFKQNNSKTHLNIIKLVESKSEDESKVPPGKINEMLISNARHSHTDYNENLVTSYWFNDFFCFSRVADSWKCSANSHPFCFWRFSTASHWSRTRKPIEMDRSNPFMKSITFNWPRNHFGPKWTSGHFSPGKIKETSISNVATRTHTHTQRL